MSYSFRRSTPRNEGYFLCALCFSFAPFAVPSLFSFASFAVPSLFSFASFAVPSLCSLRLGWAPSEGRPGAEAGVPEVDILEAAVVAQLPLAGQLSVGLDRADDGDTAFGDHQ